MDQASAPAPPGSSAPTGRGRSGDDAKRNVYRITLSPGPDTLRRGVNPLGVLDELRELGESTLTTDPDLVPLSRRSIRSGAT